MSSVTSPQGACSPTPNGLGSIFHCRPPLPPWRIASSLACLRSWPRSVPGGWLLLSVLPTSRHYFNRCLARTHGKRSDRSSFDQRRTRQFSPIILGTKYYLRTNLESVVDQMTQALPPQNTDLTVRSGNQSNFQDQTCLWEKKKKKKQPTNFFFFFFLENPKKIKPKPFWPLFRSTGLYPLLATC